MKIIIFVLLLTLVINQTFLAHMTKIYKHLKHSQTIMKAAQHQLHHLQLHHHQETEIAELSTTLTGFNLHLQVSGIDYELSVDTGSSDIWIKGQEAEGEPKNGRYKCGQYCINNYPHVSLSYLDGPLDAYATNLNVKLNNHSFNCEMLVAYKSTVNFDDQAGLVGLSYPSLARHEPTFIQTLMKQNIINKYAYGMNLNIIEPDRAFITFGDYDENLFEGELNMYDILSSFTIQIDFDWMQVGEGSQMLIRSALLDTGNSCITLPERFQDQILKQFNTKNNRCIFTVERTATSFSLLQCRISNFDELPNVKMNIQGDLYTISPQFYIQACDQRNGYQYCDILIETMTSFSSTIFLGDGFFNSFYTFFDLENRQVGIAHNRQNLTFDKVLTLNKLDQNQTDWADWGDLV